MFVKMIIKTKNNQNSTLIKFLYIYNIIIS